MTARSARIVNDPDEGRAARELLVTNDVQGQERDRQVRRARDRTLDR
jgi:hypothetical protein